MKPLKNILINSVSYKTLIGAKRLYIRLDKMDGFIIDGFLMRLDI